MKPGSLLLCALLFAGVACDDDGESLSGLENLSASAQQFVSLRLSSTASERAITGAALQQSYQSLVSEAKHFNGGRKADTTETPLPAEPWKTCAEVTETTHPDGSVTTVYDYGDDGCEEGWGDYTYLHIGKFMQTYRYTSTREGSVFSATYLFSTQYDNYGGKYHGETDQWFTDGTTFSEGASQYDTALQKFSGSYHFYDTMAYGFGAVEHRYTSGGESEFNGTGCSTVSQYSYTDGNFYYRSQTLEPIVTRYDCYRPGFLSSMPLVWAPVSGRERIEYKQAGGEGIFEIDYGNGECDNIIFIIENGKTVKVDLGELWTINSRLPNG